MYCNTMFPDIYAYVKHTFNATTDISRLLIRWGHAMTVMKNVQRDDMLVVTLEVTME